MNDVERVKLLCKKNGITISELEKTLSFSNGSLGKVKNELSRERVTKIANYFNVSKEVITGEDAIDNRIKVYGSVPAGIPLEAIEDVVDWEDIPKEWLIGGQEYIGLKVKGDSMYPKYLDGDTVIVRLQPDCECGQEAVVYTNGYDATLKKVVKQQDGIMLQPLNPEYVPSVYPYGDDNQVKILGVVVEIRRKV